MDFPFLWKTSSSTKLQIMYKIDTKNEVPFLPLDFQFFRIHVIFSSKIFFLVFVANNGTFLHKIWQFCPCRHPKISTRHFSSKKHVWRWTIQTTYEENARSWVLFFRKNPFFGVANINFTIKIPLKPSPKKKIFKNTTCKKKNLQWTLVEDWNFCKKQPILATKKCVYVSTIFAKINIHSICRLIMWWFLQCIY